MGWPDYFPENCPPGDAGEPDGTVFRFVKTDPPSAGDFECHWNAKPQFRQQFVRAGPERHCQSCGLSLFTDEEDARKAKNQVPALRKFHLAVGTITGTPGRYKATPSGENSSHHTLWTTSDPSAKFQVVEPEKTKKNDR